MNRYWFEEHQAGCEKSPSGNTNMFHDKTATVTADNLGSPLLTWINFNTSMDK